MAMYAAIQSCCQIVLGDLDIGRLYTLRDLQVRAGKASDTGVNIPKTGWLRVVGRKVVLDKDGTLLLALSADDKVRQSPLCLARRAVRNLHNSLWSIEVVESRRQTRE